MKDSLRVSTNAPFQHTAIRDVACLGSHALVTKIRRAHDVQQREPSDRLTHQIAALEKTACKPLSEKTGAACNENFHGALTHVADKV
jgi:hypothetical protein